MAESDKKNTKKKKAPSKNQESDKSGSKIKAKAKAKQSIKKKSTSGSSRTKKTSPKASAKKNAITKKKAGVKKAVPRKKKPGPSRAKKNKSKKTAGQIRKDKALMQIDETRPSKADIEPGEEDRAATERGDEPMSVVDHLDELRSRILYSLVSIILLTIAGFFLSDYLLEFINAPFVKTGHKLNIFKLTGGFMIRLKASLVAGLMIGLPIILYQIWKYIAPAISKKDRRFSVISMSAALFLFYGGMSFVFFILLPFAINILLSFIGDEMLSTIGASDYMSFILLLSVAMGILFELPIIIMILTRIGIVTPRFLISKRKYAVVLIWIIAAVITPQDILSQVLVAVPLMLLYEISIVISRVVFLKKMKNQNI